MPDKNRRIDIRVSENDLLKIDRLAAKAKMSRTDFMVSSALNKSVTIFDGGQEIVRQLMKLGTNVNQITALAHIYGFFLTCGQWLANWILCGTEQ